uniref:Candidate secreted effector n=1 Tax=Meloidogyne incognita TaxID=6306 RepID=A0A914LA20_MELIC
MLIHHAQGYQFLLRMWEIAIGFRNYGHMNLCRVKRRGRCCPFREREGMEGSPSLFGHRLLSLHTPLHFSLLNGQNACLEDKTD